MNSALHSPVNIKSRGGGGGAVDQNCWYRSRAREREREREREEGGWKKGYVRGD